MSDVKTKIITITIVIILWIAAVVMTVIGTQKSPQDIVNENPKSTLSPAENEGEDTEVFNII